MAGTPRVQIPLGHEIADENRTVGQQWAFWFQQLAEGQPPPGYGYVIDGSATSYGPMTIFQGPTSEKGSSPGVGDIYFAVDTGEIFVEQGGNWVLQSNALTGDISKPFGSKVTTLATVNPNVGTWGNGGSTLQVTVDGKGRVTEIIEIPLDPVTVVAAGPPNAVQFNNSGFLGGVGTFTWTTGSGTLVLPNITMSGVISQAGVIYRTVGQTVGGGWFVTGRDGDTSAVTPLTPDSMTLKAGSETVTTGHGAQISIGAGADTTGGTIDLAAGLSTDTPGAVKVTTDNIERLKIDGTGAWELAGVPGTAKQSLVSNGAGAAPTWQDIVNSIVAGTNITVSSGTGDVTVNAVPSGGDAQLQFNLGGVFGASSQYTVIEGGANLFIGDGTTLGAGVVITDNAGGFFSMGSNSATPNLDFGSGPYNFLIYLDPSTGRLLIGGSSFIGYGANGDWYLNNNVDPGTTGQVITSQGVGVQPIWATPSTFTSPLTTKGDIFGFDTADARIPVGTDGQVLTADSTSPLGVSYQPATGDQPPFHLLTGETFTVEANKQVLYGENITLDAGATLNVVGHLISTMLPAVAASGSNGDVQINVSGLLGAGLLNFDTVNNVLKIGNSGATTAAVSVQTATGASTLSDGTIILTTGSNSWSAAVFSGSGNFVFNGPSLAPLVFAINGAWLLANGTNAGTTGQVLTSQGSSAQPTWTTPAAGGADQTPFHLLTGETYTIETNKQVLYAETITIDVGGSLVLDGSLIKVPVVGGAGTPAGPSTAIQWNNSGAFQGNAEFEFDNTGGTWNQILLGDAGGFSIKAWNLASNNGVELTGRAANQSIGNNPDAVYVNGGQETSTGNQAGSLAVGAGSLTAGGSFQMSGGSIASITTGDGSTGGGVSFISGQGDNSGGVSFSVNPGHSTGGGIDFTAGIANNSDSMPETGGSLTLNAGHASHTSNTDGDIILKTGDTSIVPTSGGLISFTTKGGSHTPLQFNRDGEWQVGDAHDPGTTGQVLTSQGTGSSPVWAIPAPSYEAQVATALQTVFNTTVNTTAAAGFKSYLQVFVNGVFSEEGGGLGYTVTGPNQITFTAGITLGFRVVIYSYS